MTTSVPVTLEQRIAEKVGENLVDLIPPEQWQALVKKQVDAFTEYELPKVINAELGKLLKQSIEMHLSPMTIGNGVFMDGVGQGCNDAVKKLLEENAPNLVMQMVSPAIQQTIMHFSATVSQMHVDIQNMKSSLGMY